MTVSANTQTILLLTARFGKKGSGAISPLTPKEYGRFAEWLRLQSLTPERLLTGNLNELLEGWHDKKVTIDRISALLDRGSALALSMEKWIRAGLWVMTRSDADYPKRLKQRLRSDSPAVLFGCGNRALLNTGGLAVVGSRNIKDEDLNYSSKLGELAASSGVSIVSGGARGVDETAMLGALASEGTAVGVLANNLLRACSSSKYRNSLMENNLVLVSPFNPEAGFNAGNAMARNKYIYCLADAALAVYSGKKGGTWSGAHEDLKKGWVPLWVKQTNDPAAGNSELISAGALEAPASIDAVEIDVFFNTKIDQSRKDQDLFSVGESPKSETSSPELTTELDSTSTKDEVTFDEERTVPHDDENIATEADSESGAPHAVDLAEITLYELFLIKVTDFCNKEPKGVDELVDALSVNKSQLNAWLKQAVEDGQLKKLSRPVRYDVVDAKQGSLSLN